MEQFYVIAAVTVAALGLALWPLLRPGRAAPDRARAEQAVYRDQLAEIERDLARGVLQPGEAEAARLEISRRLLATATAAPAAAPRRSVLLALLLGLLIAGDAVFIYTRLGFPGLPDMPAANRPPAPQADADEGTQDMARAAEALEAAAARDAGNPARWLLLAQARGALGEWDRAAAAYRTAIPLVPGKPEPLVGLATALIAGNQGVVPEPAQIALKSALAIDPANSFARFYLALADQQAGDPKRAITAWLALAAETEAESPVRAEIARRVMLAARAAGIEPPALPPPPAPKPPPAPMAARGPDAAAIAGSAGMSPEARQAMIKGMMDQLAARLAQQPDDVDGWLRLARAYAVSNETAKAAEAYARAGALRPDDLEIALQEALALVAGLPPDAPLPERALALLTRVERASPGQPDALWYLGLSAAQAGRMPEARNLWLRLLPLLPLESGERKMVAGALAAISQK